MVLAFLQNSTFRIIMLKSFWQRYHFTHIDQITGDGIGVIFQNLPNVPYSHLKNPETSSKGLCSAVFAVSCLNEPAPASAPSCLKWAS